MIVITSHIALDFDGFASCVLLSLLFENSKILLPSAVEEKLRHFIAENEKEFPDLIDKIDIDIDKVTRLIIADTSNKDRLPHLGDCLDKLERNQVEIFDHHQTDSVNIKHNKRYCKKVGATTSIVVEHLNSKGVPIPPFFATIGLLGIYEDTNYLSYPGTTAYDLKAASVLMDFKGKLDVVASVLKTSFTKSQIKLLNKIIAGLERFTIKGRDVAVSMFVSDDYEADVSSVVHRVMELENLKLFFCIFQLGNKSYLIAKNNYNDIDLKQVMGAKLNGGGHEFVYSASFKKKTVLEVRKTVDEIISGIPSLLKAKHIARPAVSTLCENDIVDTAFNMMNRLRINTVAVKNGAGKVAGVVSRQDIDYAVLHGFNDMPVSKLMDIDVLYVSCDADIEDLRDIFLHSNRKIVFVELEKGEIGIITRTEAFKKVLIHSNSSVKKVSYKHRLKKTLPEKYYKIFLEASRIADLLNTRVFIVGGFVRDLILRKKNFDFDFVVTHDGIAFAMELASALNGKCIKHEKFKTALVVLKDGTRLDIATSRYEYYETPGALPKVIKGHLYHDLYRRDFTVNAMAISLNKVDFGHLVDYFGGKKDLKEKTIRVLHSLSFVDDPTRLIRAIRFKNRFKFKIGKTTVSLMKAAVSNKSYKNISGFRFLKEIKVLFSQDNASMVFGDLEKYKIFHFVDESIKIDSYIFDLALRVDSVIAWYKLLFKTSKVNYWVLYLFAIFIHLKSDNIKRIVNLLNLHKDMAWLLMSYKSKLRQLELFFSSEKGNTPSDAQIFFAFRGIHRELLLFAVAFFDNEENKKMISRYITYLSDFKLHISGDDVLSFAVEQGPVVKEILDKVLEIAIDNKITDKQLQLNILKQVVTQYK
jgi:tRNA nucleotidyltransferase (CCA-adding enzyme)